jgi:hypothetical protein
MGLFLNISPWAGPQNHQPLGGAPEHWPPKGLEPVWFEPETGSPVEC